MDTISRLRSEGLPDGGVALPDARSVVDLLTDLSARMDLESLARRSLNHAITGTACDLGAIGELDLARSCIRYRWHQGFGSVGPELTAPLRLDEGIAGLALRSGTTVVSADYQHDEHAIPAYRAFGVRSALATPVRDEKRCIGVLTVASRRPAHAFSAADHAWIETVARQIGIGYQREAMRGALQESAARLRDVLAQVPVAILTYGEDGRVLTHNPATCTLLHAPAGTSLVGQQIEDFLVPEQRPLFRKLKQALFAGAAPITGQRYRFKRLDGSIGHAEGGASLLMGSEPPALTLYAVDISARVAALEALRQRETELATLADNSPDAIARFDTALRVSFANPALLRYNGISLEQMLGRTLSETPIPGETVALWTRVLQAALRDEREHTIRFGFDTPEGRRDFYGRIVPERDAAGHIVSLLTVTRDVTDLTEAQRDLHASNWALGERVKEQRALLDMTRLAASSDSDESTLMQHAVALIPAGFVDPSHTGARVLMDDRVVAQRNWTPCDHVLSRELRAGTETLGRIEVGRRGENFNAESAFLPEERQLLKSLSDTLAGGISLRRARIRLLRQTRALNALAEIQRHIAHTHVEARLLRAVCRSLVKTGGYRLAWVGVARDDAVKTVEPLAWAGYNHGYVQNSRFRWGADELAKGPAGAAIHSGRPVLSSPIAHDPAFAPWRTAALQRGYAAVAALPLATGGEEKAVLLVYARDPQAFDAEELALLTQISEELAHGLRGLHAESRRRAAEAALRDLTRQREQLIERSTDGMLVVDRAGIIRYGNSTAARMLGHTPRTLVGTSLALPPAGSSWVRTELPRPRGRGIPVELRTVPLDWEGAPALLVTVHDLRQRLRAERQRRDHSQRIHRALIETIQAVAMTVEMRDPYTAGHQRRVATLAVAIARQMGLDEGRVEGIALGAQIHDIGKIAIPSEILTSPRRLSEIEMSLMRTHAQVGYEIVAGIEFPWPIARIIHEHHERLDGSGYPQGLKGDEIALEARIVAVADIVESMSTHRPYRVSLGKDAALAEIRKQAGRTLDPQVVAACEAVFAEVGFKLSGADAA